MVPKTLLTTLLLALVVAANPLPPGESVFKLSLARHIKLIGAQNVLKSDQARARQLVARATGEKQLIVEPLINSGVTYTASVGVGSPPTAYDLLVDTGSANTWLGAKKAYVPTTTSQQTHNNVSVAYGSGSFNGTEYEDRVTLGDLVIEKQSIGVASHSTGIDGVDGILGLGPAGLTQGTLSPDSGDTIPTVTDTAFSQGSISVNEIGISFEPITSAPEQNGEITWGGVDGSKLTSEIVWAPITSTSPANKYWGIDQTISYGIEATILIGAPGIVDTGTTLLLLATEAFQCYQKVTGGVLDSATGLLKITPAQYDDMQPLNFYINGQTFNLVPNAQIWPRSLNTAIGGDANSIYLVVGDMKSKVGSGLDFINGYVFLERFYSVYDTANERVGLATTNYTDADTN